MWARRVIAGVLLLTLAALPVVAGDTEPEVVSSVEDSGDSQSNDNANNQTDTLVAIEANTQTINNNLAFLVASVLATGGLVVGYWTGKDLLDIW